jgi:hypothetical protein
MICPYYDENYKKCNFFDSSQDQSQRDNYCLNSSNWRNCVNYSNRSYDEKVSKRLRSNPDL